MNPDNSTSLVNHVIHEIREHVDLVVRQKNCMPPDTFEENYQSYAMALSNSLIRLIEACSNSTVSLENLLTFIDPGDQVKINFSYNLVKLLMSELPQGKTNI